MALSTATPTRVGPAGIGVFAIGTKPALARLANQVPPVADRRIKMEPVMPEQRTEPSYSRATLVEADALVERLMKIIVREEANRQVALALDAARAAGFSDGMKAVESRGVTRDRVNSELRRLGYDPDLDEPASIKKSAQWRLRQPTEPAKSYGIMQVCVPKKLSKSAERLIRKEGP